MRTFCIAFCLLFVCSLNAQQQYTDTKTATAKSKKLFNKALALINSDQDAAAIPILQKTITKDSAFIDAHLYLASAYFQTEQYANARIHFLKVLSLNPRYNDKVYYTLGKTEYFLEYFYDAEKHLEKFIVSPYDNKELKSKAEDLLQHVKAAAANKDKPYSHTPLYIHSAVNSRYSEYSPSFTADRKTVVFTRRIHDDEDLYISYLQDTGWSQPKALTEINSVYNEGACCISPDGKTIVYTKCDKQSTLGSCDLFISFYRKGVWTSGLNMGDSINSVAWESQPCIANNGSEIYFSSNRKGGIGGKDLYVSKKNAIGMWTRPQNLGKRVNTIYDDESPFMHPDNQSLYFSSEGHKNAGKKDLFLSKKQQQSWTTPVTLSYPINTIHDEGTIHISVNGKEAWMVSDRIYHSPELKQKANLDFYSVKIQEPIHPAPCTYASIHCVDNIHKLPIPVTLQIYNLQTKNIFYTLQNALCEHQLITLPSNTSYAIQIESPGYISHSEQFYLADSFSYRNAHNLYVELSKPKPEIRLNLKNILFAFGSAQLDSASYFELENIIRYLKFQNPSSIHIIGHTDNIGDEQSNLLLSKQRAETIKTYFIQKSIAEQIITTDGKGESQPISSNDTEAGRSSNRRTELFIKTQ